MGLRGWHLKPGHQVSLCWPRTPISGYLKPKSQEGIGNRASSAIKHSPGLSWPSWRVKVERFVKRAHSWTLGKELAAQAHQERKR